MRSRCVLYLNDLLRWVRCRECAPGRVARAAALVGCALALPSATVVGAGELPKLEPRDVFELEWASDPQISPDGARIAYVRNYMDIMTDRRRSSLWLIDVDSGEHRPVGDGAVDQSSPRWSPDGGRLLYASSENGSTQLFVRWLDTGQTAQLTRLTESPGSIVWSPDGRSIALSMRVPETTKPFTEMPAKPEGAEWADPPHVIERMIYRADGAGYLEPGFSHLFVLPAEGGTPRQLTQGDFNHGARPSWTPDGESLIVSANRRDDWEHEPLDSGLYEIDAASGEMRQLTERFGPESEPAVSPDGRWIAYTGFEDRRQGYQVSKLYLLDRRTGESRVLAPDLDRDLGSPVWAGDGRGVFVAYTDHGNGKIARIGLDGEVAEIAHDLGGSIGRPYSGGSFSSSAEGRIAYTLSRPERPADVVVATAGSDRRILTELNADLLGHRELGVTEELTWKSSHDGREIQGWVVKPPGFEAGRRYPLVLEIHGGPFADYGDRFSSEVQLYAAAGYIVLYANPRGSSSYGEEFGNLIHHNYPSQDYDDLMSGVDAAIAKGWADPDQLFVTGGSGGGVLTAWVVGKTDRFRAAVSAKPVINWYSFALTADAYNFFHRYWFSAPPWEKPEEYLRRSPLSLVGNVTTPTMLLTGEEDYRTPISESEQYYQALKLRKVDTALVRVPGASHGIARRPSHLIAKVAHVLAWFERYRTDAEDSAGERGAAR